MAAMDPLEDTWHSRDLPILREAARLLEEDDTFTGVRLRDIAEAVEMEVAVVLKSLRVLEEAGLVELRLMMPAHAGRVTQISSRARQLVGQWPSEEQALERIIAALTAIADATDDPEEKTKAQKVAAWFKSNATTVGVGVATAALTGQLPGQQ
ncbi:hypothetical protein SFC79_11350 [Nocardioides sp. S-58]|uniref:MarR family transcriptional regulator n=1 Tax=Nocardioides renjunii TaxID=3095075 RepID=A0ABU5KBM3_9ACTN|nr:hypothetical protein [Nocardioides sp. S-58]MDZ5662361.1 hypothetical protein [Nocardioides sp. S-58]